MRFWIKSAAKRLNPFGLYQAGPSHMESGYAHTQSIAIHLCLGRRSYDLDEI